MSRTDFCGLGDYWVKMGRMRRDSVSDGAAGSWPSQSWVPNHSQSNPATEQRHLAQLMVEVTGVRVFQLHVNMRECPDPVYEAKTTKIPLRD